MKLVYVVLQVALVGAGILIYDQLRDPGPPPLDEPDPPAIERPLPPAPPPAASPVVLRGAGMDGVEHRLESIEARQRELERSLATRISAITDSGPGYTPPSVPSSDPDDPGVVYGTDDAGAPRFNRQDVDWFRAVKKEADKIERHERHVSQIHRQLNRLDVSLSEQQRGSLTDATIAYRDKVRDTVTASAKRGESREQRTAALDTLREQYHSTVYSLLPSGDADKVVESMGRYPGFSGRRGGSSRFPPRGR